MNLLRLLRRQLNRQLALIHQGDTAAAQNLGPRIEAVIERLEASPPPENDFTADLHAQCAELNELVLEHFESERAELADGILKIQIERQLSELRRDPADDS